MQFATLFAIISAVLALPTTPDTASNVIGLVKRADGSFVFPDDNEKPSVYVPKKGTKVPKNGRIVYPDEFEHNYTPKPNDQVKPIDPIKPKDQVKPNDRIKPNDQVKPIDPIKPKDQVKPNDRIKPNDQIKPKDQIKPNDQIKPKDQCNKTNQNQGIKNKTGEHPYKNAVAKNGQKCDDFKDPKSLDDVPTECLRPVFCDFHQTGDFKIGCPFVRFEEEIIDKAKLKAEIFALGCVSSSICRWNDYYNV